MVRVRSRVQARPGRGVSSVDTYLVQWPAQMARGVLSLVCQLHALHRLELALLQRQSTVQTVYVDS
jgi:hypothetical protein